MTMTKEDKQEIAKQAQADFARTLEEMKADQNVTEADIAEFKKAQVLMMSMGNIKQKAAEMQAIRSSPARYNKVTSKVNSNNSKKGTKKAKNGTSPAKDRSPVRQTQFGETTLNAQSLQKLDKREQEIIEEEAKLE